MPCLHNYADRTLVQRRFPQIHTKTDRTIQSQCLASDAHFHVTQTHPGHGAEKGVTPRPSSEKQPEQRRDKKKHWWRLVSTSPATSFRAIRMTLGNISGGSIISPIGDRARGEPLLNWQFQTQSRELRSRLVSNLSSFFSSTRGER